jgi:catechol 2,3-dioxygenase-like lactoylglutathione lyase family enzyme
MAVVSGPVIQTAWVVPDVAATEAHLSALTGIREWTRLPDIRFGPDACTFRGAPADFTAHISMAYVGDMQLELIQPVTGESIYSEFLDRTGGGLHHLCWEVDDLDAALARAAEAGMPAVQTGDMAGGSIRFAYLDGAAHGVPYVELAQLDEGMQAFYAAIKEKS